MTLKSVLDIDLDTAKFERFTGLFQRYTEVLQKQPALWKKIGGIHQEHGENFTEMAATLGKISQLQRGLTESGQTQEKHLSLSSKLWTSISRSSKETWGSIEGATRSLAKWGGLLGGAALGLLGIGSIFGFDRLAGSIGGQRRSASGLGMSIGEQQSFGMHFGRFINTDAFTGLVAGMQQDVTQQVPFRALLHRAPTGTSQDMLDMLDAVRSFTQKAQFQGARGLSRLGPSLHSMGLDLPPEDIRRLRDSRNDEWAQQRRGYIADIPGLNISDKQGQAYQNFTQQMDRVAQQLRASLGPALSGLIKPLSGLSAAFGNLAAAFLQSPVIKDGLKSLADGLNTFAAYVASPQFKADVIGFTDDIGKLADAVHHPFSALFGNVAPEGEGFADRTGGLLNSPAVAWQTFKGQVTDPKFWQLEDLKRAPFGVGTAVSAAAAVEHEIAQMKSWWDPAHPYGLPGSDEYEIAMAMRSGRIDRGKPRKKDRHPATVDFMAAQTPDAPQTRLGLSTPSSSTVNIMVDQKPGADLLFSVAAMGATK